MVEFLGRLASGALLSSASTELLLDIMTQTATGADRLRAGMRAGWGIAHKTGTGRSWQGETETINDVGVLTAPDGTMIAVAVFLARSRATSADQASVIARVARLICDLHGASSGRIE